MNGYDPTDLRGQEEAAETMAERQRVRANLELADLKWVMSNKRGRRFVYGVLSRAGVYRSSFHPTAMQMAFNEGQRSEGLRLMAMIHDACPERYEEMLQEAKNDD